MKNNCLLLGIVIATVVLTSGLGCEAASEQEDALKRIYTQIAASAKLLDSFNKQKSSYDLETAIIELAGAYSFPIEVRVPASARQETMSAWLKTFALLDREIDPSYDLHDPNDPKYAGSWSVIPPPLSNGFQYPAGVAPSAIKEPDVRAKYEADRADNKQKLDRSNFQTNLRRANEMATRLFQQFFLHRAYTSSTADQSAFNDLIDRATLSAERKQALKACFLKN